MAVHAASRSPGAERARTIAELWGAAAERGAATPAFLVQAGGEWTPVG
jgi:hypothetical protein